MAKHKWRLLLVDDDRDDHLLIRETAHEAGCLLDWTDQYDTALKAIGRNRYDAYLIDYRLGAQDGLELIHEGIKLGCSGPMILLTRQGDTAVDIKAMEAGAADYLEKGRVDAPLLERSVRYAIERKRAQAALVKRAHELAQSNATIREFADVVSDDLQDPLRAIAEVLDHLRERCREKPDPQVEALVKRGLDETERMKDMIDELTMFSQVAAQQTKKGSERRGKTEA